MLTAAIKICVSMAMLVTMVAAFNGKDAWNDLIVPYYNNFNNLINVSV